MADLTGDWSLRMMGPMGLVQMTLKITQEGSTLRGSAEGPMGPAELSGEVDGERATFSLAPGDGRGFAMAFSGTFQGGEEVDVLAGTMRAGEVSAEFRAERAHHP